MICVAFCSKFCQLCTISIHYLTILYSHLTILFSYLVSTLILHLSNLLHGAVGSASVWQTRGFGFEPTLMRYIFSGKYPSV